MVSYSRVGPYQIRRLIKQGGQGRVYLGFDQRLQRRVAIKIYALPEDRASRKRTLREAQQIARIDSPRVVQVYDVIQSRGHLAMIMEYVPGCDLEEFLQNASPSLASVLRIGVDVAAALAAARQRRIVHGDVKAANILVTATGRAKLTDFGIATGPQRTSHAGSLSALSPEQFRGESVDVRTDLFALGCLLYRMLCCEHPFYHQHQLDPLMLLEHDPEPVAERVPADVELPAELEQLIGELLQKRPEDRPLNTHRVRRLLRKAGQHQPLADSGSLLREATPFFRPESTEDVPLPIPPGLAQEGRSRIENQMGGFALGARIAGLGLMAKLGLLVLLIVSFGVAFLWQGTRPDSVYLVTPSIQIDDHAGVPAGLNASWLLAELRQALENKLGNVRIDDKTSRVIALEPPLETQEHLGMSLRCSGPFCLLVLSRNREGETTQLGQVAVLPDMPLEQWRIVLGDEVNSLYD